MFDNNDNNLRQQIEKAKAQVTMLRRIPKYKALGYDGKIYEGYYVKKPEPSWTHKINEGIPFSHWLHFYEFDQFGIMQLRQERIRFETLEEIKND